VALLVACHDLNVESEGVWKEVVVPCVSVALPLRSSGLSLSIAHGTSVRMK